MYTIANAHYTAKIAAKGAELKSLVSLSDGKEHIFQGDVRFWEDSAPLLFPICGKLNDNRYAYGDKEYEMFIHGFLMSLVPTDVVAEGDLAVFHFADTEETYKQYPFHFALTVTFTLTENGVNCAIVVENRDEKKMYYSIGAHPGFSTPLREGATLEDHYLRFPEATDDVHSIIIDNAGLFSGETPARTLEEGKIIRLSRSQFIIDGIFLNGVGDVIELHCDGAEKFVRVSCPGTEVVGVWRDYDEEANMMCLEPWRGYPSISGQKDELEKKFGIHMLESKENVTFAFDIEILPEQA